jgi:hypothetical protein
MVMQILRKRIKRDHSLSVDKYFIMVGMLLLVVSLTAFNTDYPIDLLSVLLISGLYVSGFIGSILHYETIKKHKAELRKSHPELSGVFKLSRVSSIGISTGIILVVISFIYSQIPTFSAILVVTISGIIQLIYGKIIIQNFDVTGELFSTLHNLYSIRMKILGRVFLMLWLGSYWWAYVTSSSHTILMFVCGLLCIPLGCVLFLTRYILD